MRHQFAALAAALLALSACDAVKIERTPRGFYTQRDPARIDQQDAASELRARVRNFADELGKGNRARAMAAINPTEDVLVIGAEAAGGVARIGPRGFAVALDSVALPSPALGRPTDLRVEVGLHESTGWFSTPIQFMPVAGAEPAQWLRASGVFSRDRGEWKLVQIHLSRPYTAPDTAAAGGATPADSPRARRQPAQPPNRSRG